MVKIGIIGLSEGNGHPFSFSAIINGFDQGRFAQAGWPGILKYLKEKDISEIGMTEAKVTHAWTQNVETTKSLCESCYIKYPVNNYIDMIDKIDALIIARDDFDIHYEIAKPFLEKGIPIFIDKPLSLNLDELFFFKNYLEKGFLMSCSGLRYARELDGLRNRKGDLSKYHLIRGTVINSWEKYGIHLLDAIFSIIPFNVQSAIAIPANHQSIALRMKDNSIIYIDTLGPKIKIFQVDFFFETEYISISISDNFSAFKRTLSQFIQMVETKIPPIEPELTINLMKTLIAGQIALNTGKEVYLNDIYLRTDR